MFKHIRSILLLKDVADVYKEEKGKDKSIFLSRRFIGVVIATGSAGYFLYTGNQVNFDIELMAKSITDIATAVGAIYGMVMLIVGQLDKTKVGN